MRTLYTILFFGNTLLLVCLSYLFLQKLDHGGSAGALILTFLGIAASILLLGSLIKTYLKQPSDKTADKE